MTLKRELEDPASMIRRWLAARLPDAKPAQHRYREAMRGADTTVPDPASGRPPWDVIGHAISARILWHVDPTPAGTIAGQSATGLTSLEVDSSTAAEYQSLIDRGPDVLDAEVAARVAWVGGLLDRLYRTGRRDDPHVEALTGHTTLDGLLAAAPQPWIDDTVALTELSLPLVAEHRLPGTHVAPTFAGSRAVGGADADYVTASGLLVDVKAAVKCRLRLQDLQQIVSYALLDWDDMHSIRSVGILAVRQGRLVTWDLVELLKTMAGTPVDIDALRQDLRVSLDGSI